MEALFGLLESLRLRCGVDVVVAKVDHETLYLTAEWQSAQGQHYYQHAYSELELRSYKNTGALMAEFAAKVHSLKELEL